MSASIAANQTILIGGGISGMTAVQEAAECAKVVEAEIANPCEYGLSKTRAVCLPHAMAYPQRYVLDAFIVVTLEGEKAKAACKYNAIELDMQAEAVELKFGAVVWATGWKLYYAAKMQPYGYDRFDNVITSFKSSVWPTRTARPLAVCSARRTARKQRTSRSFSVPDRMARTTCATARVSAVWFRCGRRNMCAWSTVAQAGGLDGHVIQSKQLQDIAGK